MTKALSSSTINITKTYLPPIKEYQVYLRQIWKSNWITNNGPLVNQLEKKLKQFFKTKHLFFVSNGTIALQIAIKALDLKNEIITTPFSYVATTSSIVWENCKPVFIDIDPNTLCLNPKLIEAAVSPYTTGILATHVYGYPCNIQAISKIATKYKLKVIYDAAHAFAVNYKNRPLVNYGDISILSFHATKLFHTVEGGALITNNHRLAHKISYLRNFGHKGQETFWGLGINGKNSELHAAMGLCLLPKVSRLIKKRRQISQWYDYLTRDLNLIKPKLQTQTKYNFAYYPVIFPTEKDLLKVKKALNKEQIFPRRYFYPSLNTLSYVTKQSTPKSEKIASRVLCLPLSYDLQLKDITRIVSLIKENL